MKSPLFGFIDTTILSVFFFGFSSGLPFLLTLSTLSIWLKESNVNNTTIGLFVLATLPYTFKFLWGPLVDKIKIPLLFLLLGQRRSWAFASQCALIAMLIGLGSSQPESNILITAGWAFGVAFCSAIQDIVIEAYRIESTGEQQKGSAASAIVLGWRLGTMAAGAGALFLAATFSWQTAYNSMAALMLIGLLTTLFSPSTIIQEKEAVSPLKINLHASFWLWLQSTYGVPFKKLCHSHHWHTTLALIFFYKVGDTALNVMSTPFLVELGFSVSEIAHIAKIFGISAMIAGGFMGGFLVSLCGIIPSLMLCLALQFLSSLMFILQASVGRDLNVLVLTVGIENFASGLGTTAFIAYLSSLCHSPHTATQFAILSSFASMARVALSIGAGILADKLSWLHFFTLTAVACLPGLCLLTFMNFPIGWRIRTKMVTKLEK